MALVFNAVAVVTVLIDIGSWLSSWLKRLLNAALMLIILCSPSYAATILVLGDSLSAGYGIDEHQGWVKLLQQDLSQHTLINGSVSGETTAGALRRLPNLLASSKIDLVLIELGGNDGLRGFPPEKLKSNLTKIVELAQSNNAKVLLTEIMVPPNYGPRYSNAFNQVYHQVAKDYSITLAPFFMQQIAPNKALMQRDGIHPNAKAQATISQWMKPWIETALK